MATLIECPECGSEMQFAMIDIDGTNLEEGYECLECGNEIFGDIISDSTEDN